MGGGDAAAAAVGNAVVPTGQTVPAPRMPWGERPPTPVRSESPLLLDCLGCCSPGVLLCDVQLPSPSRLAMLRTSSPSPSPATSRPPSTPVRWTGAMRMTCTTTSLPRPMPQHHLGGLAVDDGSLALLATSAPAFFPSRPTSVFNSGPSTPLVPVPRRAVSDGAAAASGGAAASPKRQFHATKRGSPYTCKSPAAVVAEGQKKKNPRALSFC